MPPVPDLRLDIAEDAYEMVEPSSSRLHGRWTDGEDFDLFAIDVEDEDDDEVEVKGEVLPGVRRGFLGDDPDEDPGSPSLVQTQTGPSSLPITSRTKEVGSPTQTTRSIGSSSMIAKAIPSQTEEEESRPSPSTSRVYAPSTMTERPSGSTGTTTWAAPAEITAAPLSSSEWHAPSPSSSSPSSPNTNTGRNSWAPDPTWSSDFSPVPTSNTTFTDQIKAVSDACTESTDSCRAAAKISPIAATFVGCAALVALLGIVWLIRKVLSDRRERKEPDYR